MRHAQVAAWLVRYAPARLRAHGGRTRGPASRDSLLGVTNPTPDRWGDPHCSPATATDPPHRRRSLLTGQAAASDFRQSPSPVRDWAVRRVRRRQQAAFAAPHLVQVLHSSASPAGAGSRGGGSRSAPGARIGATTGRAGPQHGPTPGELAVAAGAALSPRTGTGSAVRTTRRSSPGRSLASGAAAFAACSGASRTAGARVRPPPAAPAPPIDATGGTSQSPCTRSTTRTRWTAWELPAPARPASTPAPGTSTHTHDPHAHTHNSTAPARISSTTSGASAAELGAIARGKAAGGRFLP